MSTMEQMNVVVSFALPVLIAAINRRAWADETKALVAFFVCMATGMATAYLSGSLAQDLTKMAVSIVEVLFLATGYYKLWWKPLGMVGRP